MPDLFLTAQNALGHIHLIIGSNSLASARCARSLQVGATPKLIAPAHAEIHYALKKRIGDGEVEWIRKDFEAEDLQKLGRTESENVVDAVFVTVGGKSEIGTKYGSRVGLASLSVRVNRSSCIEVV